MAALARRRERSALAAERRVRAGRQEEAAEGGGPQLRSRGGGTPVLFGRRAAAAEDIRAAIVRVYSQHNPERLDGVDRLMAQHAGAEAELLAKIVAKYNGSEQQHSGPADRTRKRSIPGSRRAPVALHATRAERGRPLRAPTPPAVPLPPVAALPLDLLRCCLRWLTEGVDLGRCACVCRVWRTAAQDDGLWKPLYLATWPPTPEGERTAGDDSATTPRRAPGTWQHSFRVRWVRQCEGRLRSYVSRMARIGKLNLRRGAADCYDPTPNFGSLRKIVDGLGLSFFVRVNGGTWHAARQLTNSGGRRHELRDEVRGLSCSLRCPTAALVGVDTTDALLSLEIIAKSSYLGRRFVVCSARCRCEPTTLESRRGTLPAASELWRLVFDDAVRLYELPMGGCARNRCRTFRPGGVSSSGGGASSITVVAFEEIGSEQNSQLAPLGGSRAGPASALQSAEGVGAVYCHVSHADVVEQLLGLTGTRLDPGVPLSPTSRGDYGSSRSSAAAFGERLGGRRGSISKSLGSFQSGNAATLWGHSPRVDDLDSLFGLHDYAVGVTLRSFGKTLWEEFFQAVDADDTPPKDVAGKQQHTCMRTRQADNGVSLVLVSREQAMGAGWDSLGRSGRSMDAPCLLWRSEGGLSGAAAGCVLAEIAVWDDAGELICARTQVVHLAPVAENSVDTEKAAALRTSYGELTTFQLKKICREKRLNAAGTDAALIDRLVAHDCPPKSRARDPCSGDGRSSTSERRNGGAGTSGQGSLDFNAACAEERLLRGTGSDRDGDVTLSIEVLLEEGGGIIGGKGGGGSSEVVDLRVSLSGDLMREWWGDGWSSAASRMLQPQQADVKHYATEDATNTQRPGTTRRSSLAGDSVAQWNNDFTESHKPTAIGLSENDMLSMKPSQLRDLCNLAHVPKSEVDQCLDSSNPKQAYIALLVRVHGFGGGNQAAQQLPLPTQRTTGSNHSDGHVHSNDNRWQHDQQEPGLQPFGECEPLAERDPKDIGDGWSSDW